MLERGALERFVDDYADHAYAFAMGLCGNEPDARELVQEAFVKIFDKADLYDESQPLDSWFLTVLKNVFRDGSRRCERRLKRSLDAPIDSEGLTVADAVADPREEAVLDRLEREESVVLMRRALSDLPPAARAVLTMIDVEGLGYENAARVLGCPLGTVRSRLNRARALLRGRLLAQEEATR
jgi:RNA polymerase sigma-70 factor, ECF subfamily